MIFFFQDFFLLDAMTMNHQGKYFIIRKRFRFRQNGRGKKHQENERAEQNHLLSHRKNRNETNKPAATMATTTRTHRFFFVFLCGVCCFISHVRHNQWQERDREKHGREKNRRYKFCVVCCCRRRRRHHQAYWRCSRLKCSSNVRLWVWHTQSAVMAI